MRRRTLLWLAEFLTLLLGCVGIYSLWLLGIGLGLR